MADERAGRASRGGAIRRRVGRWGLTALAVAYAALAAFPGLLFAYHARHGTFQVASDEPIGPGIARVLDRASALLARSPWYDPTAPHRLFLANGAARRRFLSPMGAGAFGSTFLVRRNSILNRSDIAADVVRNDAPRHNRRTLSGVIAHERTHAMLMDRLGVVAYCRLPSWKNEGYCDYIADESSFDPQEGFRLIREGRDDASPSFRYFKAHLMVRYLLEVERVGVEDLFARDFDEGEVIDGVRGALDRLRFGSGRR